MTSRTQILIAVEFNEVIEKANSKNQVVRMIDGDNEIKKHSRTSPDVQFKEFSLTKQNN